MRIKLASPVFLSEIKRPLLSSDPVCDALITHITTDSREALCGDLFLSLAKRENERRAYEEEARNRGAFILSPDECNGSSANDMTSLLLKLSEFFLSRLSSLKTRIAITGSVGKTTTKELLFKILSQRYKTHATFKNYNNSLGLLISILMAPIDTEVIILEVGTNHPGEIASLSRAIKPTISAITNVGSSHIGNFGSKEALIKEKTDITIGMDDPILICDYSVGDNIRGKAITTSTDDAGAQIYLKPTKEAINYTDFSLYHNHTLACNARINIGGRHILSCLSIAIALAIESGCSYNNISSAVEKITDESGRHRIIAVDDYFLLVDCYNSSIESVRADFELMKHHEGKVSAVLGDIYELGERTEEIHRELGALAYSFGMDRLYLFGDYSEITASGAIESGMHPSRIFINSDLEKPNITAEQVRINHTKGELILLKASHKVGMNRVAELLTKERKE